MEFDIELASYTDIGKIREKNEDSTLISPELCLGAVADGMGGHNAGEIASNLAVSILEQTLMDLRENKIVLPKDYETAYTPVGRKLLYASSLANYRVYTLATENIKRSGMGTTLSAIYIEDENNAAIVHIGDSRVYLYRNGTLSQITTDHSFVQQQVALGNMTKEDAEKSRIQNILMKALGLKQDIKCDIINIKPQIGDTYVLCSDGVNKGITDNEMLNLLKSDLKPTELCKKIVKISASNDGKDNTSCVIVHVSQKQEKSFLDHIKSWFK
ncbi:MAG: serine/threonine-protein phosphatase [Elusimicrobiaceae bacterium]|nr:serine/threonine-protein phosphatase [Elusimicrobiaceae bacterium]